MSGALKLFNYSSWHVIFHAWCCFRRPKIHLSLPPSIFHLAISLQPHYLHGTGEGREGREGKGSRGERRTHIYTYIVSIARSLSHTHTHARYLTGLEPYVRQSFDLISGNIIIFFLCPVINISVTFLVPLSKCSHNTLQRVL